MSLTKKQRELLDYISHFGVEHGYSPSYRELAKGVGSKSISTIAQHIEKLVGLGVLQKKPSSARSLEVVKAKPISDSPQTVMITIINKKITKLQAAGETQKAEVLEQAKQILESDVS